MVKSSLLGNAFKEYEIWMKEVLKDKLLVLVVLSNGMNSTIYKGEPSCVSVF